MPPLCTPSNPDSPLLHGGGVRAGAPALSFSSSFLGFYSHAGFLAGMRDAGVRPVRVAGSSSGSLVAAMAGVGMSPEEMMEFMVAREFRHSFIEIRHLLLLPLLRLSGRPSTGLTTGRKALACLKVVLGDRRIEDCKAARVGISVTHLSRACTEIRESGPLAETVLASCAYPTVIQHQTIAGDYLCDGGIANDGPFGHWIGDKEVPEILVHGVGGEPCDVVGRVGLVQGLLRGHEAVGAELFRLRKELAQLHGQRVSRCFTNSPRPMWFVKEAEARKNFELGRETGRAVGVTYAGDGRGGIDFSMAGAEGKAGPANDGG